MTLDLADRLQVWVDEGLITREQADRIRERESRADGHRQGQRTVPVETGRVSLVVEAVGYVGAALVLVAGSLLVERIWDQLQDWSRLTLVAALTAAVITGGWWIRDNREPAIQRLVSVLWFVGVAGVAFTAGLAANLYGGLEEADLALAVGTASAVAAVVLWRARPRVLQHLGMYAGVMATILALLGRADPSIVWVGVTVFGVGLAWGLLSWGELVPPRTTGEVVAILSLGLGTQMMAGEEVFRTGGLTIGIAGAAGLIVASIVMRRTLYLAFGVLGIFIFVPELIFRLFADSIGAPLALFLTGVLLVGGAVGAAKLKSDVIDEGGER